MIREIRLCGFRLKAVKWKHSGNSTKQVAVKAEDLGSTQIIDLRVKGSLSKRGEVCQIEANGGDLSFAAAVNRDLGSRSDQARYAACFHACFHIDMKRHEAR